MGTRYGQQSVSGFVPAGKPEATLWGGMEMIMQQKTAKSASKKAAQSEEGSDFSVGGLDGSRRMNREMYDGVNSKIQALDNRVLSKLKSLGASASQYFETDQFKKDQEEMLQLQQMKKDIENNNVAAADYAQKFVKHEEKISGDKSEHAFALDYDSRLGFVMTADKFGKTISDEMYSIRYNEHGLTENNGRIVFRGAELPPSYSQEEAWKHMKDVYTVASTSLYKYGGADTELRPLLNQFTNDFEFYNMISKSTGANNFRAVDAATGIISETLTKEQQWAFAQLGYNKIVENATAYEIGAHGNWIAGADSEGNPLNKFEASVYQDIIKLKEMQQNIMDMGRNHPDFDSEVAKMQRLSNNLTYNMKQLTNINTLDVIREGSKLVKKSESDHSLSSMGRFSGGAGTDGKTYMTRFSQAANGAMDPTGSTRSPILRKGSAATLMVNAFHHESSQDLGINEENPLSIPSVVGQYAMTAFGAGISLEDLNRFGGVVVAFDAASGDAPVPVYNEKLGRFQAPEAGLLSYLSNEGSIIFNIKAVAGDDWVIGMTRKEDGVSIKDIVVNERVVKEFNRLYPDNKMTTEEFGKTITEFTENIGYRSIEAGVLKSTVHDDGLVTISMGDFERLGQQIESLEMKVYTPSTVRFNGKSVSSMIRSNVALDIDQKKQGFEWGKDGLTIREIDPKGNVKKVTYSFDENGYVDILMYMPSDQMSTQVEQRITHTQKTQHEQAGQVYNAPFNF